METNTDNIVDLVPVNPIGKHHGNIASDFLERVRTMIATDDHDIKKYAIEDSWQITESLELKINGKQKLQIQLINEK